MNTEEKIEKYLTNEDIAKDQLMGVLERVSRTINMELMKFHNAMVDLDITTNKQVRNFNKFINNSMKFINKNVKEIEQKA
jgi:hypothetical protein